jgi:TRAP-type C4-dicarboxylate transport system substrate-binding protein
MSVLKQIGFGAALVALLGIAVMGQAPTTIKLATQAPVNSTWHKALTDMGAEVAAKTADRVKLTVYAGGTQGDEPNTIRSMRVDGLQANLLMAAGLSQIDESFNAFGMPFFFQSDEETAYVLQKLGPTLEKRLDAKGFHLLSWGSAGWVQLFSKQPLTTLADVKKAKLFTSNGDDRMVQWYKNNGFTPVALAANDIVPQLKTGTIDAAPSPPYPALVLQMYTTAKYMLDVRVGPLLGALVITNTAWNKIAPADRPLLSDSAKAFEKRIMVAAPQQDAESVAAMKKYGLTVTTLDPKATAEFRAAAEKLAVTMRGNMVPADIYDLALQERDAFRKTKGK